MFADITPRKRCLEISSYGVGGYLCEKIIDMTRPRRIDRPSGDFVFESSPQTQLSSNGLPIAIQSGLPGGILDDSTQQGGQVSLVLTNSRRWGGVVVVVLVVCVGGGGRERSRWGGVG